MMTGPAILGTDDFLLGAGLPPAAIPLFKEIILNDIHAEQEACERMISKWGAGRWKGPELLGGLGAAEVVIPKALYANWCQHDGTDRGENFDPDRVKYATRLYPAMKVKYVPGKCIVPVAWAGSGRKVVKRYEN